MVDGVDQGSERGRLARSGLARDEHDAALDLGELEHGRRQAQRRERRDLIGEKAQGRVAVALAPKEVDAHADIGDGGRAVPLPYGRDAAEVAASELVPELLAILMRERGVVADTAVDELPMETELDGQAAHEVDVGRTCLVRKVDDLSCRYQEGILP